MAPWVLLWALGLLSVPFLQGAFVERSLDGYEVIIPRILSSDSESGLVYQMATAGRTYILHLLQNTDLLDPGFSVYTQNSRGQLSEEPAFFPREHCHYYGYVDGISGSIAAINTCSGLLGFWQTGAFTYAIEPVKGSDSFQHIVYKVEDMETDIKPCLTVRAERTLREELYHKMRQKENRRHSSQAHFMQIYVVVDNDLYQYYHKNITRITDKVIHVLNMADAMFVPLRLQLVLSGCEIWNVKNVVPSSKYIKKFLQDLVTWKEKDVISRLKVDMVVLMRKDQIQGASAGTFDGEICWSDNALLFLAVNHDVLPVVAGHLAHELGHSIGIPHDSNYTSECLCPQAACIMLNGAVSATSFSACSLQYYNSFIAQGGGYCLQTVQSASLQKQYTYQYCGNRIVEGEEQCDCGTKNECIRDPCCNSDCKLRNNAQCSSGECCKRCQFIKQGIPCRKPVSECDLAEYCTGISGICPEDVYSQDGSPCNDNQSYCVSKICYDYDQHCQMLFGKEAVVAAKECFALNNIGDQFGNCGFQDKGGPPIKCKTADVMCGRVHCEAGEDNYIYKSHSVAVQTPSGNVSCLSVDFSSIPDTGAVADGAQCGIGKICLARKCVELSVLDYDCDIQEHCSGRGVCNNNKKCHCNKGWAPPNCTFGGFGGSVDSGPLVLDSFISYIPPEQGIKFKDFEYRECHLKKKRDLEIGLGITLPLLAIGIVLAVVFRHQIMSAFT
ncbi:disintegrin and metalloproteinase domain-containing protein 9-like [Lissotriton helveticus]